MASIFKRKGKEGKAISWRAVIRLKGYPTVCESFERKQEAEDWAKDTERKIKLGQFQFDQHNVQRTFEELSERFVRDGCLEHHRSREDTLRHHHYWKSRFGKFALVHITADFIGKEREILSQTPTERGVRSAATTNRYMASLSSLFTYAKKLGWISENPCLNLMKLKESSGRDRILSPEEIKRLLIACQKSKSSHLYSIVLMAITTGARRGEILNLQWGDIDLERGIAHLKKTKNGYPRSVALESLVIEELKKLYQTKHPLKSLIFSSKTAFGKVDIKKSWKKALEEARIEDYRLHDLRHGFASMAAGLGASNLELATAMGHKTLAMLQRYTHLDVKTTQKYSSQINEKVEELLQREKGPDS